MLNFIWSVFCIGWGNRMISGLRFIICCIMLTGLCMLNHPCISGMKPTRPLSWSIDSVCKHFIEKVCIYVFQGNWSIVFFVSLSSFCNSGNSSFIEWAWECFFPFHFMEQFEEHWRISLLKVWETSVGNVFNLGFSFAGSGLYYCLNLTDYYRYSTVAYILLIFFILLNHLSVPKNLSILYRLSVFWSWTL